MVDIAQQGEFANLLKQRLQQPQTVAPISQPSQGEFANLVKQTLSTRQQTQPITTEQPATVIQPQQEIEALSDEQINQLTPETIEGLAPEQKQRLLVKKLAQLSPAEKTILSLGAGFANIARGVRSLAATATGDEEALAEIERGREFQQQVSQEFRQEQPILTPVAEIGGEVLATVGAPFAVGATIPARIASTTATGAALGAVSAAGRGDDVVGNALLGAGLGAGFQGLTEVGKGLARRIINAKQGRFANDEIAELIAAGDREGVEVFVDDVARSTLIKQLGTTAEKIPLVGTLAGRLRQSRQQSQTASNLRNSIIKEIDDTAQEAQKGLTQKLEQSKQKVADAFAETAEILNPHGNIPLTNLKTILSEEITKESARAIPNQKLINTLDELNQVNEGNFSFTRDLITELNDFISAFFQGDREAIGGRGVGRLMAAKRAIQNDLDGFSTKTGSQQGLEKFSQAKKLFQEFEVPFIENKRLAKLVKTEEPEDVFNFVFAGTTATRQGIKSRAKKVFNLMTPDGREAIKAEILQRALSSATKEVGGREIISAAQFANQLEKFNNINQVFFNKADKKRIDGVVKLFRATQRASQVAENPPTGQLLLVPGALTVAAFSPGIAKTVIAAGGFGAATKAIFQSKLGRNLIFGLSKTTPGTKAAENQLQKINNFLIRVSTAESASENQ